MCDNPRMKNDARQLSTSEQALMRRLAVQRVLDGEKPSAVTQSYRLGEKTIFKWLKVAKEQGIDALAPKPRPGRTRALTEFESAEVKRWILSGDPR